MMKQLIICWLCLVPCSTHLFAQDFKEDYKRAQEKYAGLKNFSCSMRVDLYEKINAPAPEETMKTVIKKKGNSYLYETDNNVLLINEKCLLNINRDQRRIVYTVKEKNTENQDHKNELTTLMDSLLNRNDSVLFKGVEGGKKKYIVHTSSASIIRSEIYLDQHTGLCSKLVYYYKADRYTGSEKVIVEYEHMNESPVFGEDDFSEKKYATYNGKVLKPAPAYSNYKTTVIDPATGK